MKMMKLRFSTTAVWVLAAMVTTSVMGATSGNLGLSGSVPVILELSVSTNPAAAALTPSSNVSSVSIGTVTETCNDADGYTVLLSSSHGVTEGANAGVLVGGATGEQLNYNLSYNGQSVNFSSGTALVTDAFSKTAALGDSKAVSISYDGTANNLATDTYTDTLTFTIAAK